MSIHALLVEAPGKRIIVDTCLGNDKQNRRIPTWNDRQGTFLADLAAAGFARETIDTVLCTHLHVDHVGWNTMLVDGEWVPTFPNARYLFGRVEFEHWSKQTELAHMLPVIADSVQPILDRGLAELVEWDHQICPGGAPDAEHRPFARPRQRADHVEGRARHDHRRLRAPSLPDGAPGVGVDRGLRRQAAEATRRRILGELAGEAVLMIGTHFAGPTAGRVVRDGDAFRLDV